MNRRSGFTIIELSIVLVIIGLIVGGVLVGRDLIHAAEIRATVSQVNQFNTAVHTFQIKYNCLPGDCANPADFGFFTLTSPASANLGNGQIDFNEQLVFWQHLSEAGLIPPLSGIASDGSTIDPTGGWLNLGTSVSASPFLPTAKFRFDVTFRPVYMSGPWPQLQANGFVLDSIILLGNSSFSIITRKDPIPMDVFELDQKIDDGMPNTGSVVELPSGWNQNVPPNCTNGGTWWLDPAAVYDTTQFPNVPGCSLFIRWQ